MTPALRMNISLPLQYAATGGGGRGYVSIWWAVALVEVGAADIVDRGGGEVLRWFLGPSKLFLGLTVNFDRVQHGHSGRVNGRSNFEERMEDVEA